MSMLPWSPYREAADWPRWNRFLDDVFWREPWREGRREARMGFPVDVFESNDDVLVRADLPGVRHGDIQVQWTAGHLVISARREAPGPQGATAVRQETFSGEFTRSFDLGIPVDADRVSAEYEDGVLAIRAPKAESVKPRSIPVRGRNRSAEPETRRGVDASADDGARYETPVRAANRAARPSAGEPAAEAGYDVPGYGTRGSRARRT